MRPLHVTDLDLATRTVLIHGSDMAECAAGLVAAARLADRYRKRLRRRHPVWGDGTLAGACGAYGGAAAPRTCDTAYRRALALVLAALDAPL